MHSRKTVLITGASSRLGQAICQIYDSCGFQVFGLYNSSKFESKSNIKMFKADISKVDECRKIAEYIKSSTENLDVFIHAAGLTMSGKTLDLGATQLNKLMEVNVYPLLNFLQLFKKSNLLPAKVVVITSVNGLVALPNFGIYSASKFALEAIVSALRIELSPLVQISSLAPGAIENKDSKLEMTHKPAREKFPILKLLLPMLSVERVAKVCFNLTNKSHMPSLVVIGADARLIYFLNKYFRRLFFEPILSYIWSKK